MTSLNKLAIRGIRSFDHERIAFIEFSSPVTVIVGHNGSGKTTIIECLKYATTGDQPPNTRGGAFIHDPKIAQEKEVKAQVKLKFTAANGQNMLVVRNLSVTVRKSGQLAMKTLESILGLAEGDSEKGGKRAVISTKCAEIDTEIPNLLGVSKAVLENVIFCHQEDSYWPLSEPAILKKKFDDIFEATKYTKALDSIKSLRKDRVAELKAEKERLESLSREKAHADKLRSRISDLTSSIAGREIEYEETKQEYEKLVAVNQKFYDSATKFREVYMQVENLQKEKKRYQEELDSARENLQELSGTDEELSQRLRTFDVHIAEQKRKHRTEQSKLQDIEEELEVARKAHAAKLMDKGQFEAEANAQEQRITEREGFIRDLAAKFRMKGYDHSPLEREKIVEFINALTDLRNQQNTETEALQDNHKSKNDEYNAQSKRLHGELTSLRSQKESGRDRIATLNSTIARSEEQADAADALTSQLKTLEVDMEEKERRLQKIRDDIKAGKYEERLADKTTKARGLELKKEDLEKELNSLSIQADTRARLDLKREALRTKGSEVKNILEINNPKFRKLVGADAHADTMEREVERVFMEKEREQAELESFSDSASKELSAIELALSNLRDQAKAKRQEIKRLDHDIKEGLEGFETTKAAVEDAKRELTDREQDLIRSEGSTKLWKGFLADGRKRKRCPLCARDMNDKDLSTYEKTVDEQLKKCAPESVNEIRQEVQEWEKELRRLQELSIVAAGRDKLKSVELPALERQIQQKEAELPATSKKAQEALERLKDVKKELREIAGLKEHATSVSRSQQEIQRLQREIASIESELLSTGSTKTVEDLQTALETARAESHTLDREKQTLMADRERQLTSLRMHENDLHALQLNLSEVKSQLRDKSALEKRIGEMKQEVTDVSAHLKGLDTKVSDVESAIQRLELEYKQTETELNKKISEAQRSSQDLNRSVDKLESFNKPIERYVREKRARLLKDAISQIEDLHAEIQQFNSQLEAARTTIGGIEKEIHESGASMANLRENIRVRKLVKDIATTQAQIDTYDMEEAAKAKRIFQEKYQKEKDRETEMQSKYAHIGGELSSLQAQLKQLDGDLKEFKDINKRYRDQLIRVKMSDMANNDLEKYAKALDNAIMKYHSLKMEEVNDTMRHLWSKTYQGSDIDGIKISSDSEGGATKRSYNYRVVMTKDGVEMDMRGRCSAGQKMLASIIIRLALADSFGQNCGILALDEPTNALDMENIDALAASLVDIINERRKQSNFQLLIITHDENFLRKLGQAGVMDSYWRVSRDAKQKSVISPYRLS